MEKVIPVETSARHIHLSPKNLEALFGKEYKLHKLRELTLPKEFAAEETLSVRAGDKSMSGVRVVGPLREETQLELALTDAFRLEIEVPVRTSGDIEGTPGITLIGPKGEINIEKGVIIAQRHIHCNPEEAEKLGVKDRELVSVKIEGERSLIFHKVRVRVSEDYKLCMHVDTDEGNAAGITKEGQGVLL